MKTYTQSNKRAMRFGKLFTYGIMLISALLFVQDSYAQDEEPEEKEAFKVLLQLNYFDDGETNKYLTVKGLYRDGRKKHPVENAIINLYLNEYSKLGMMGNVTTDEEGRGTYILPEKFYLMADTLEELNFIAMLQNDERFVNTEKELTIRKANLDMELYNEDSVNYIRSFLTTSDTGGVETPVGEAEVKFFVQRTFSRLPLVDELIWTDDNGEAVVEFPSNMPGDTAGNLIIVVQIPDHEEFGTLTRHMEAPWGTKPVIEEAETRALWGTKGNAPIWLVFLVNGIIVGVWGALIYIVYMMFQIKKESKGAA